MEKRDRKHVEPECNVPKAMVDPFDRGDQQPRIDLHKVEKQFGVIAVPRGGERRGGGGVLPYIVYIGMCGPKGYGFSAVLVINRVSSLADFGHKQGMVFVL